ncbi:hypothetical protein [Runella sp.]|uniref:hypothetical protein n=1 Tax=Runella sp. TaxID=1960881 RepID=UPI003D1185D0
MGKGGLTKFQLAQRLKKVSDMYLQGIEVPDIANKVGVSESQVYKDLAKQKKEWQQNIELNTNYVMAQMMAETDVLKFTYWQAWRRSQEDAKTTRFKVSQKNAKGKPITDPKTSKVDPKAKPEDKKEPSDGLTQSVDKSEEIKGKEGNPAFLRGVEWCLNFQAELLGLKKFNLDLTGDIEA